MPRLSPGEDSKDANPRRALRVLVADDDADTVETLATLLRLEGHEVREVLGGAEAEASAAALKPRAACNRHAAVANALFPHMANSSYKIYPAGAT
jgi:CheY-like chemotaxis protein